MHDTFLQKCKKNHVNFLNLDARGRISSTALRKLIRFIDDNEVDLVHARLIEAEFYLALIKLFRPRLAAVCSKHNTDLFRKKLFYSRLDKWISIRMDSVIAVSEAIKDFLVRYEKIPGERVKVIYNGIKVEDFRKAGSIRYDLGLSKNDFIVGTVGRLTEQKNHITLFRAIRQLVPRIKDIRLLVVGDGELRQSLESWVLENNLADHILFLGKRDDMGAVYSAMDLFCMPSLFEGFGRTNAEALLCGVPVISSNIDGIIEVIEHGKHGYLVSPKDTDGLSSRILWVFRNYKQAVKTAEAGRDRIKGLFTLNRMIRDFEKEYVRLVG